MESLPSLDANQQQIAEQIERWKQSPVILASRSAFRKQQLETFGFQDVTPSDSLPDELESDRAEILHQGDGAAETHWDADGSHLSEHIAAAKVEYVLNNQTIPTKALVIGFDTTAVVYDTASAEKPMGIPRSKEKFATLEAARENILEQFARVAHGCCELHEKLTAFSEQLDQYHWSEEDTQMAMTGHVAGIRRGHIFIHTGVAVAFPAELDTEQSIHRWTEKIKLFSQALYEAREDPVAREKLVDAVMQALGEQVLDISGGIDYSNRVVQDILQLSEQPGADSAAEAVYKGFSERALATLLHLHAHEILTPDR